MSDNGEILFKLFHEMQVEEAAFHPMKAIVLSSFAQPSLVDMFAEDMWVDKSLEPFTAICEECWRMDSTRRCEKGKNLCDQCAHIHHSYGHSTVSRFETNSLTLKDESKPVEGV